MLLITHCELLYDTYLKNFDLYNNLDYFQKVAFYIKAFNKDI